MVIKLFPQRRNDAIELSMRGDVLTVNGNAFDLSDVAEGATLPASAIGSTLFCGDVERVDGVLHISLILPHGPNPPHSVAFPAPLIVTQDGKIEVPK